jgi:multicomponent Na+:H+ antiporter subunit G
VIVLTVLSTVLLLAGLFFLIVSAVGLLRLPEVYTRTHAVSTSETVGVLLMFAGLLLRPELDLGGGLRLALILAFSLIANPTAVHALVRAAKRQGVAPWRRDQADQEEHG